MKRPSPAVIVLLLIVVLGSAFLALNQHVTNTRNEMEVRVRDLLQEYVSVPLPSSIPPAMVDGVPALDDDGNWRVIIRPSNFDFVTEEGDSQNKGYVMVLLDGKVLGTADTAEFPLGKISGEHMVTLVLTDAQKQLYRFNSLPVRKTLRGYFLPTGFEADNAAK